MSKFTISELPDGFSIQFLQDADWQRKVMAPSTKAPHLSIISAVAILLVVFSSACGVAGPALQSLSPASIDISPAITDSTAGTTLSLPPQGLYESCLPHDPDCLDRLTEMGTKGFRVVLNDGLRYASRANDIRAYADHAQKLGMKVILPIKYFPDWDNDDQYLVKEFPELAAEGGSTDNASFLAYYIGAVKEHPALWGYYMVDEVHSEYHQGLKIYSDLVKNLDPHHPRLIVEEGTNDPMEIFFTFHSYMHDTTDVVALDNYPYGYIETYGELSNYTGDSARMLQYWSDKLGLKNAIVLQAFSWTQYAKVPLCMIWPACARFPSYEQMKAQRDQAILNSKPEIILWFYYEDILNSDDPTQHWNDLVAAAFAPLPAPIPSPTPRPQVCPAGWVCEDIGNAHLEGTQSLDGDIWTIEGSGRDIWSNMMVEADQFRYVWQPFAGGGELNARVLAQTNTDGEAKAGIMVRKTFDPVAPYYAVLATPRDGIRVQYRSGYNENPAIAATQSYQLPVFLRISRTGTTYSASTSADGVEWSPIQDSVVDLPALSGSLMAGLAVTSRNPARLSEAQFDNVVLVQPKPTGYFPVRLPLLLRW